METSYFFFVFTSFQPGQEQTEISILLRDLENCNNDTRMCARKVVKQLSPFLVRNSDFPSSDYAYDRHIDLENFEFSVDLSLKKNKIRDNLTP